MVDGRYCNADRRRLLSEEVRPLQENAMNSPWKTAAAAVLLLIFVCVGCAHIVMPDWFIKRSGLRKGGDLLTEWNRIGFRVAGAIFAGLAVYLLYVLFHD